MTFKALQDKIADKLRRTDLTDEIKDAIKASIAEYAIRPLWVTQQIESFSLVADSPEVLLPDIAEIYFLEIDHPTHSRKRALEHVSWEDHVRGHHARNHRGTPSTYAVWGCRLGVWPVPDRPYVVRAHMNASWPALVNDHDSNTLIERAEPMIMHRALARVLTTLRNMDLAKVHQEEAEHWYQLIKSQTDQRDATGYIQGYW